MLGGFGSIQGMINSLRENRKLLRRKSLFDKAKSMFDGDEEYPHGPKGRLFEKKASAAELNAIKAQMSEQKRLERLMTYGIIAAIFLVVFATGYWVVHNVQEGDAYTEKALAKENEATTKKHLEQYQFYIAEGDKWLRQNHWNNAIFQYKEALEVSPNNLGAKHRLVIAYTYKCKATQENCEEAKNLIDQLIEAKPDKKSLYELRASYKYAIKDSTGAMKDYDLSENFD